MSATMENNSPRASRTHPDPNASPYRGWRRWVHQAWIDRQFNGSNGDRSMEVNLLLFSGLLVSFLGGGWITQSLGGSPLLCQGVGAGLCFVWLIGLLALIEGKGSELHEAAKAAMQEPAPDATAP